MEIAPYLCSPGGPTSKGDSSATLLSSMWSDGKGHHVYTSYSSSGVLIKEDEQKTIAVARKPPLRAWVKEIGRAHV